MNMDAPPIFLEFPTDVHQLAIQVLGSQAVAARWMGRPAPALDGRCPGELLGDDAGVEAVRTLLMRIEYGVYC
jgi:putative toxin-antitoxin system antitoxin component (TIGR02293 family)